MSESITEQEIFLKGVLYKYGLIIISYLLPNKHLSDNKILLL